MMALVLFNQKSKGYKKHKIRSTPNPLFMRFINGFFTKKIVGIYQEYIGGEGFGLHRAGNKYFITLCDVQRCSQRMCQVN